MTKWGERPHWTLDPIYLGADRYGDWLGFPTGSRFSRPGVEVTTANDQVGLVPAADLPMGNAFLATFHGPGGRVWTYVDMTTVPVWDGPVVRAVDLDLDVVERLDHSVFVDDEDEFEEHRLELGYPPDVVALATGTRDAVLAAVRDRRAPFDGSSAPWLGVLRDVLAR
jgi:hypothetical protein